MMRLFTAPFAPNPMRVQILALEKGVELEYVDVTSLDQPSYLRANPLKQVPALELDTGEFLTESLIICQYLDAISRTPSLYGATPLERARIGMWDRRAEVLLFNASVEYGHHTHPMFARWQTQYPDWAQTLLPRAKQMIGLIADQLDEHPFVVGAEISAADFTAALGYFALVAWGAIEPSERQSVAAWSKAMIERPSMVPLRAVVDAFKNIAKLSVAGDEDGD